jgi:RimJ/RimL family protein N-acetyltransferase
MRPTITSTPKQFSVPLDRRMRCVPEEMAGQSKSQMERINVNIPSKVFDLIGVRIVHFKHRMEDDPLRLRLYRLRDLPVLRSLLKPEIFLEASGAEFQTGSLLSFYKWIRSRFQVVYVIEMKERGGHRVIGFAGLYRMRIGESLWLSLTIFSPEDRSRGYGTKALELLLDLLQKNGAAETVYAEVSKTNGTSLWFLRKVGFKVSMRYEDSFILEKKVLNIVGEPPSKKVENIKSGKRSWKT